MIDDGLFDRFPARAVYGMHNFPGVPAGDFVVQTGPVLASADEFTITVRGAGGHAAFPHKSSDPIVAGAQIVSALQSIVARKVDPLKPAVISVTQFHAGSAHNVIPDEAVIGGTMRSFDPEVDALIRAEMRRLCESVAAGMGVSATLDTGEIPYPPCINDAGEAAFAARVLEALVGADRVDRERPPTMGGEDFAFMAQARPGAFVFIGNGNTAPLHTTRYDFNDDIAPVGVAYWTRLVEAALPAG
jgi:hippurate hydrolase